MVVFFDCIFYLHSRKTSVKLFRLSNTKGWNNNESILSFTKIKKEALYVHIEYNCF